MKRAIQIFVAITIFTILAPAFVSPQELPKPDLRIHTLESKVFNHTRKIRVLLPPNYEVKKTRYPVLYLNDGQNLFDEADAIFNNAEWKVDETVYDLIAKGKIPPIIVVGIDNAGKKMRPNEYLPWEDEYLSPPVPDPKGALYPEFLEKEVIPFVESKYRVGTEKKDRGLGGSSYGALIALYSALKKPDLFGKLLLESPSFYVSDAKVLVMAESAEKFPSMVYIGVGTNEGGRKECDPKDETFEAVVDVKRLAEIVKKKEAFDAGGLKVVIEPCAVHHEDAWAKRLPQALKFLFSD
ncbi:MAG TPA: alpha/beta hydrolase-fold protein [Aridibacter sp.]|nr:alpha/beta hydrolase-fold protein [Aridibacter sp.]